MIQVLNGLPLFGFTLPVALGSILLIRMLIWVWDGKLEVPEKCAASVMLVLIYVLVIWILLQLK